MASQEKKIYILFGAIKNGQKCKQNNMFLLVKQQNNNNNPYILLS